MTAAANESSLQHHTFDNLHIYIFFATLLDYDGTVIFINKNNIQNIKYNIYNIVLANDITNKLKCVYCSRLLKYG